MNVTAPGVGVAIGLAALLVIALIVVTGHCSFAGSVSLGLR